MRSYQKHTGDMEKGVRNLRKEKGFTLIEVLFAIAILAFGLLAVASMQIGAIQGNLFASGKTRAVTWAQDRMERLMALPFNDADLQDTNPTVGPTTHSEPSPPPGYTITWDVDDFLLDTALIPSYSAKQITVTVTPQIRGVGRQVQLTCVKPRL